MASKFARFESTWLHASLILMNWNSDWDRCGQAGSRRRCSSHSSVASSIAAVQITEACFVYRSCNTSHTLLSAEFKSGEFGGHSWGGINSGVSLSNNSIVARARWALQVWDIIQAKWETFTWFCGKFIRKTVYQISALLPEFCSRYY